MAVVETRLFDTRQPIRDVLGASFSKRYRVLTNDVNDGPVEVVKQGQNGLPDAIPPMFERIKYGDRVYEAHLIRTTHEEKYAWSVEVEFNLLPPYGAKP